MTLDPKAQAAFALHRFGFGPRPGSIAAIAVDPRGAILAELDRPNAGLTTTPNLPSAAQASRAVFEFNAERQAQDRLERKRREAEEAANKGNVQQVADAKQDAAPSPAQPKPPPTPPLPQQLFQQEVQARIEAATSAEIGFVQRLVWFWSNHFCISTDKVPAMAGGYEREAIRKHVCGRFADMLQAVEGHPAMLFYLDNAQSIGPNSVAGINADKGLNENLAREILELHTLGVRTVYTQDDVTNFAKVITGWTIIPSGPDPERGGEFVFNRRMHEPGPQTVIGKTYQDTGVAQGRAVLADLARRPATAKHIAEKLACHFVADQPPASLVEKLANRFIETDGDLKAVAATLVLAPEAWQQHPGKLKRPSEWIVSALRATGVPIDVQRVIQGQNLLGEPLWRPPAPKGFSDENAAWMDGLATRLDVANEFGRRVGATIDPMNVADTALGPLASAETHSAIQRAESRPQALTLLLMAPEFQYR
jgi:uncharacterized protein (DUF1800 family)